MLFWTKHFSKLKRLSKCYIFFISASTKQHEEKSDGPGEEICTDEAKNNTIKENRELNSKCVYRWVCSVMVYT